MKIHLTVFYVFFGIFPQNGRGYGAAWKRCSMNHTGRRGSDGSKYRSTDAGGYGETVLPQLRCGGHAKRQRPSKDILLGTLQVCVEEQKPAPGKLEIHPDGCLPGVWETISGKPGVWESEEILQPCLCQQRTGETKGA